MTFSPSLSALLFFVFHGRLYTDSRVLQTGFKEKPDSASAFRRMPFGWNRRGADHHLPEAPPPPKDPPPPEERLELLELERELLEREYEREELPLPPEPEDGV